MRKLVSITENQLVTVQSRQVSRQLPINLKGLFLNQVTNIICQKLFNRWRGSVYKLVWRELIAYLCLYYTINVIYRFGLTSSQQA